MKFYCWSDYGGSSGMEGYMILIINEMLRKTKQGNVHNTTQHNTTRPKQLFFKEKIAASGGTLITSDF